MKQLIIDPKSGEIRVEEVPPPQVKKGFVLVKNHCSIISIGTERSTLTISQKSLLGKAKERPDLVKKVIKNIKDRGLIETYHLVKSRLSAWKALGYSCAGEIIEVGEDIENFQIGDYVACGGQDYASHAEVVIVPKNLCVKIPKKKDSKYLDFEEAAFATIGAIALQGVRQADLRVGEIVAVLGLGLIGQLVIQICKAAGCMVLGSDIDKNRLKLAKELGADEVCLSNQLIDIADRFTNKFGFDAVIITAATKSNQLIEIAGEISRKKGKVVIVGQVGMNIPRETYYKKELELRLSCSYGPGRYDPQYEEKGIDYPYGYVRWTEQRNMDAFLNLIAQDKVSVKRLITHRFSIDQALKAYEIILKDSEPYLGIILNYPSRSITSKVYISKSISSREVALGIIGAGHFAQAVHIPHLMKDKRVKIVAVCNASGISAKSVAEKIKADYCTTDYREILKDDKINTVLIATRHDTHGIITKEALNTGKHVFVEKPLCLYESELEEIAEIYRKYPNNLLMVGFNRRFSPHAKEIKEFFSQRDNPLVMSFRINAGSIPVNSWIQDPEVGGGRIIGECCHFIDFMEYISDELPKSIYAIHIGRHTSGITTDQVIITLGFENGSIGTLIYTAGGDTSLAKERFEAFGDGKAVVLDDFKITEFYYKGKKRIFKTKKQDKGHSKEISAFIESIVKGKNPPLSWEEIEKATKATFLVHESLKKGIPIYF